MTSTDMKSSRTGIQVISRAARILRSLKEHPEGLSLGQIATDVALPRSTVQRIVGALQTERLLISNTNGNGVRLGPELAALADAASFKTAEQCRPLLLELAQSTGETADLSVLRGEKMIFVDQVPGTHRLRTVSSVGETFPLVTTANGRACLAKLPHSEAMERASAEVSQAGLPFDMDTFCETLNTIQETGFAYDFDEHAQGISAIGFAFKDWAGDIHAISVPVPSSRFALQKEKIEACIKRTSATIETLMHSFPPD